MNVHATDPSALLGNLTEALATGAIEVVDLTHTLDQDFPVIVLPPEFGQCARFRMEEVSAYDHRGPAWKWHNFTCSEHTGTHFDAPSHWISGRDVPNGSVDEIPAERFIGPVCVIDCSEGAFVPGVPTGLSAPPPLLSPRSCFFPGHPCPSHHPLWSPPNS